MDDGCPNEHGQRGTRRRRDRVVPWVTLLVALGWLAAGWVIAREVREYNSKRAVLGLITAGIVERQHAASTSPANSAHTGLPWISFPPLPETRPADGPGSAGEGGDPGLPKPLPLADLKRATSFSEVVVYCWERMVWAVAGSLLISALIGFWRHVRFPHLLAAAAMLAGTIGTLLGTVLLVKPNGGAFHALPAQSYLLIAVAGTAYPLALVLAFARRPGR